MTEWKVFVAQWQAKNICQASSEWVRQHQHPDFKIDKGVKDADIRRNKFLSHLYCAWSWVKFQHFTNKHQADTYWNNQGITKCKKTHWLISNSPQLIKSYGNIVKVGKSDIVLWCWWSCQFEKPCCKAYLKLLACSCIWLSNFPCRNSL